MTTEGGGHHQLALGVPAFGVWEAFGKVRGRAKRGDVIILNE
jgi:hypothetical protein